MWISNIIKSIMSLFGYTRAVDDIEQNDPEYRKIQSINFTAIFANSLKDLIVTDSTISAEGTSNLAIFLNEALEKFSKHKGKLTSYILGYGGAVLVPYVINKKIHFDIINHTKLNFIIDKKRGDEIRDCTIFADKFEEANTRKTYYRFTRYYFENDTLIIQQIAKNGEATVNLTEIPIWKDFPPKIAIKGAKRLPIVYFKNPKDSRLDHYFKGVPITYGCDSIIEELKECLIEVRKEFKNKKAKIFIDSQLLDKNENVSKDFYKLVTPADSRESFMNIFSPEIRNSSFYNRILELFSLLEKAVGTSSGILTEKASRGSTATEIKYGMRGTYSIISEIRKELESGIYEFVDICIMFSSLYNLVQMGEYKIKIDWSYDMIEDSTETYSQLVTANGIGAVSKAEIRQYIFPNETIEEAQEAIDRIAELEPSLKNTLGY